MAATSGSIEKTIQDTVERMEMLITEARNSINLLLSEYILEIGQLPDNPNIVQRQGKSFSLKSSALGMPWDPFYHDWKSQYTQLQEYLSNAMSDSKSRTALNSIIKHGTDNYLSHKRTYHPEVLAQVVPMLEGPVTAIRLWHANENGPSFTNVK